MTKKTADLEDDDLDVEIDVGDLFKGGPLKLQVNLSEPGSIFNLSLVRGRGEGGFFGAQLEISPRCSFPEDLP